MSGTAVTRHSTKVKGFASRSHLTFQPQHVARRWEKPGRHVIEQFKNAASKRTGVEHVADKEAPADSCASEEPSRKKQRLPSSFSGHEDIDVLAQFCGFSEFGGVTILSAHRCGQLAYAPGRAGGAGADFTKAMTSRAHVALRPLPRDGFTATPQSMDGGVI